MENEQKTKTEEEKKEPREKPSKKGYWLFLLLLIILAILTAVIIYIWLHFLKKPSTSDFKITEGPVSVQKEKAYERFEGKYVSFSHPDSYKEKNHEIIQEEEKNILERAFFSEQEIISRKIALTVEKLPDGNLQENANFHMRETYPDRYKKEKFSQGEIQGTSFFLRDSNFFEKVIFIQKGNLVAELALTASLPTNDDLNLEIENMAESIKWLK